MFDIGWQELFILAVIALIVIGPKDLPRAIRIISKGIRKARSMARDLQEGMDDVLREAELDDLKEKIGGDGKGISKYIEDAAGLDMDDMNLDGDLRDEMTAAVEDLKSITTPEKTASKKAAPKKAKAKKAKAKKAKTNKTKAVKKAKAAAKAPAKAPAKAKG